MKVLLSSCEIHKLFTVSFLHFFIYDIVIVYHFQNEVTQNHFKCTDVSLLSTMLVRFIFSFCLFHHELGHRWYTTFTVLAFVLTFLQKYHNFISFALNVGWNLSDKMVWLNILTVVAISLYATYKASLLKVLHLPLWSRLSFLGQATEKINSPTFFYLNLCMCWNPCVCYLICSNLPDIKWWHVKIQMSYLRQTSKLTRKLKSNVTGSINLSAVQLHFKLKNAMDELSLYFNLWFCTTAGLVLCHTVITVIIAPN